MTKRESSPNFTLKNLYIHNYKSFYDSYIEFDKLNIVVAPNNAGKSNLIDVLEFIDIALNYEIEDIEKAIREKGGFENIKNYNNDEKKIVLKYTIMNYHKKQQLHNMEIYQSKMCLKFTITETSCQVTMISIIKNNLGIEDFISKKFVKQYFDGNKKTYHRIVDKNYLDLDIDYKKFHLKTYYFNPQIIREKSHIESESRLQKDGANLGKNLSHIKNSDKKDKTDNFEKISLSLVSSVEEIDNIDIVSIAGQYILVFKERDKEININRVSDGTINLIATITALNQPNDRNLFIAFEEPERHLHLKAINYLLDAFRNSQKQILITTHSSEIMNSANLNELIFMYRNSYGDTKMVRADKIDGLEQKLKNLGYKKALDISELIERGIIDFGDFE